MLAILMVLAQLGCSGCGGRASDKGGEPQGDDSKGDDSVGETGPALTCLSVPLAEDVPDASSETASGFQYCYPEGEEASGDYERETAVACTSDPHSFAEACSNSSEENWCNADDECTSGLCTYRNCACRCIPVCVQDADCGDGYACICRVDWDPPGDGSARAETFSVLNECLAARCRTNADCASGVCALSIGGYNDGLFCRTAEDTCRGDGDCTGGSCAYNIGAERWECVQTEGCD